MVSERRWKAGWEFRDKKQEWRRQCEDFDSRNCQRLCIIDVLAIPHCH